MTISHKQLSQAIGELDFAMTANSYGASGGREVLANAVRNLPTAELEWLRQHIAEALKAAVSRTQKNMQDMGIVLDEPHPFKARASIQEPGSYFYKKDRIG